MKNLKLAEKIILGKIHKTNPHLKYAIADIMNGLKSKEIADKYGLAESSVRNFKSRYKQELIDYEEEKEE